MLKLYNLNIIDINNFYNIKDIDNFLTKCNLIEDFDSFDYVWTPLLFDIEIIKGSDYFIQNYFSDLNLYKQSNEFFVFTYYLYNKKINKLEIYSVKLYCDLIKNSINSLRMLCFYFKLKFTLKSNKENLIQILNEELNKEIYVYNICKK